MGLLWFGSIILYSISTVKLGALGPVIGWPLFLGAIVIASTVLGVATGEWANTGKSPIKIMIFGVSCLVLAIAILGYASNFNMTNSASTPSFYVTDCRIRIDRRTFLPWSLDTMNTEPTAI